MTVKIKAPRLPQTLALVEDIGPIWQVAAYNDGEISGYHFKNLDLSGYDFTGMRFSMVLLENCRLVGAFLDKASFLDVVFKHCDLSNVSLNEGYFNRCSWQACKWLGAGFLEARLQQLTVEACNLQYANFDEASLSDVAITESDCSQAVFSSCQLKNFQTRDCRFWGVNFFRTALRGIDFSEDELEGITVSEQAGELQGMVVNVQQAAELAKLLGIVIKA